MNLYLELKFDFQRSSVAGKIFRLFIQQYHNGQISHLFFVQYNRPTNLTI